MPFDFRMILSGLMVAVPGRRFLFAPADSMNILVPNLRRPRLLEPFSAEDPQILDPHFPFLEFPEGARLDSSTRQVDLARPVAGRSLCHLAGEEIEILVPGLDRVFTMNTLRPVDLEEPTPEEERSLFWIATVEEASPGKGLLKPDLLTAPLENDAPIATRLRFDTGHFCTHLLSTNVCRFEPQMDGDVMRRYAIRLALEITGVPDRVTVSMKKGEVTQELHLAPRAGQTSLEIQLSNRELEDILNPNPSPAAVAVREPGRPLADFHVFYDFSRDFVAGEPRRFLQEVEIEGKDGEQFPPHALCPPTGMALAA